MCVSAKVTGRYKVLTSEALFAVTSNTLICSLLLIYHHFKFLDSHFLKLNRKKTYTKNLNIRKKYLKEFILKNCSEIAELKVEQNIKYADILEILQMNNDKHIVYLLLAEIITESKQSIELDTIVFEPNDPILLQIIQWILSNNSDINSISTGNFISPMTVTEVENDRNTFIGLQVRNHLISLSFTSFLNAQRFIRIIKMN